MGIKKFNPTSPGIRFRTVSTFEDISRSKPERKLVKGLTKSGGRNNHGRVTSRHIGGGHKRRYRTIDFKRDKRDIAAKVATIEYDPNRSSRIALLHYADGEKRYILAPVGLRVGDSVMAGEKSPIQKGNALPLRNIPVGSIVHNIELRIGKGGQLARGAGTYAQFMAKEGDYAQIKLPSNEVRTVHLNCYATIGQVGNVDHSNLSSGKAGRTHWLGRRSKVRGVAMNPVDHPLGGGEGKSSGGRHPVTPWGVPTKGYKTRRNKDSDKYIIRRRRK